jgi:hypothetical protein
MSEEKRDTYIKELIKTGLVLLRDTYTYSRYRNKGYLAGNEFLWRSLLPYTFHMIGDSLLPLNRDYKPLGLIGYSKWAEYGDYDFLLIPLKEMNFTQEELDKALKKTDFITSFNYNLYLDHTCPWDNKKTE